MSFMNTGSLTYRVNLGFAAQKVPVKKSVQHRLNSLNEDVVSFSSKQVAKKTSLLQKLAFSGAKKSYNWHEKENWWAEVDKALKSKAKDKPMILIPEGQQPVLRPTDKKGDWQNIAVYNPGAIYEQLPGDDEPKFHILYRASDCCYPNQPSVSRWGLATSKDGINLDSVTELPVELPKKGYEVWGIEDPRITKIDDTFYIAYCAYSPEGPRLGLMSTTDFKNKYELTEYGIDALEQQGVITEQSDKKKLQTLVGKRFNGPEHLKATLAELGLESVHKQVQDVTVAGFKRYGLVGPNMEDKDVVLFPGKIDGKFAMMHRLGKSIQLALFDKPESLTGDYWKAYMKSYQKEPEKVTVLSARFGWEDKLGAGPPPVKIPGGWLFIYHTSKVNNETGKRIYTAGACILDEKDPTKVLHRVPHPMFVPVNRYEKQMSICPDKDVVFPTGICKKGEDIHIYSGAGDKFVELYKIPEQQLIDYIKQYDAEGVKLA